jgi:AAA domain
VLVHGDKPEQHKQGYSLRRTILAHGNELDPRSEHYFELDINKMSSVPEEEKRHRLGYILKKYPLDPTQREAFDKATSKICVGVHLIQGPPGTGKTRTALVIILALASLKLRVLLAVSSNNGVDNLAIEIADALQADKSLERWCGQVVRLQTYAHQISILRANSVSPSFSRKATGEVRGSDHILDRHEQCGHRHESTKSTKFDTNRYYSIKLYRLI